MPEHGKAPATAMVPSWLADLDTYLQASGGVDGVGTTQPVAGVPPRRELVAAVKALPSSPEAWLAFLSSEEAAGAGADLTSGTGLLAFGGGGSTMHTSGTGISLYHLYYWATQLVPRAKNQQKEEYARLWLGYARQQWARSPDDARDTFKTLRNSAIGAAGAHLYADWAGLEYAAGNVSRALGILAKGYKEGAQPTSLLDRLKAEMQSGTFDLKQQLFTETMTLRLSGPGQHTQPLATQQIPLTTPAQGWCGADGGGGGAPASARAAAKDGAGARRAGGEVPPWPLEGGAPAGPDGLAAGGRVPAAAAAAAAASAAASVTVHSTSSRSTYSGGSLALDGCAPSGGGPSRSTATAGVSSGSSVGRVGAAAEEDTISCGLEGRGSGGGGGGGGGSQQMDSSQPRPAHVFAATPGPAGAQASSSGHHSQQQPSSAAGHGASSCNTTGTIGLKRFGFKSRALRVGGAETPLPAAQEPATAPAPAGAAAQQQQQQQRAMAQPLSLAERLADAQQAGDRELAGAAAAAALPPAGAVHPASAPVAAAFSNPPGQLSGPAAAAAARPAAAGEEQEDGAHGRKRRADTDAPGPQEASGGSKLAATSAQIHLQQQQRPSRPAGPAPAAARVREPAAPPPAAGSAASGAGPGASGDALDSEDSLPLVLGRLAEKLVPERGTPVISHSHARRPPHAPEGPEACGARGGAGGAEQRPAAPAARRRDGDGGAARASGAAGGGGAFEAACDVPRTTVLIAPTVVLSAPDVSRAAGTASGTGPSGAAPRPAPAAAAAAQGASRHEGAARPSAGPAAPAAARAMPPPRPVEVQQEEQQRPSRQPLRPVLQLSDAPAQAAPGAVGAAKPKPAPAAGGQQQPQEQVRPQQAAAAPPPPQQQQQQQQAALSQQQQQQQAALSQQQKQQAALSQQQQQQQPVQRRAREDANTVYVQGVRYTKLECVGRGGSSKVFKVMGPTCKIFALKRIRLQGRDAEAAAGFVDEINLLNSLKGKPNIIQLIDAQVFTGEGLVYMVQEYGEIDLARLLAKHEAARRQAPGGAADAAAGVIDENFVRLYWQQMLQAVATVHELRIVHSDLKPANYLMVEGQLKLIDFGIAKAIGGDTTSISRESQVGTLNYMSPEAILGGANNILGAEPMKVGRPSDIWSLGCILYQMVYGRTPFADLPFIPKMHAICDPRHAIKYPPCSNPDVVDVMARCLDRDPKTRITMPELLDHPFLHPNRRRAPPPCALPGGTGLSLGGLDAERLRQLVSQVAKAGASGVVDIEQLTKHLMSQLAAEGSGGGAANGSGNGAAGAGGGGGGGARGCGGGAAAGTAPRG